MVKGLKKIKMESYQIIQNFIACKLTEEDKEKCFFLHIKNLETGDKMKQNQLFLINEKNLIKLDFSKFNE